MKEICLHGIFTNEKYESFLTRKTLIEIIKSGYLYSKNNLNRNLDRRKYNGWNSCDYISLCDFSSTSWLDKNSEDYKESSFNQYISQSLSFVFNKEDLDIISTKYIPLSDYYKLSKEEVVNLSNQNQRYSTMIDEVQVKDEISLDMVVAMNISYDYLKKTLSDEEIEEEIFKIHNILKNNFISVPIYDVSKKLVLRR